MIRRPAGETQHALIAAAVVVTLAASGGAFVATRETALAALDQELADRLTVTRYAVVSEIERYRYLPSVVGQDARILRLLDGGDARAADEANAYLQTVRDLSHVDELFLLDASGRTVATSNWNTPDSFLGQVYAFRPYFREALTSGEGRYYAVGVTTGKPGYFLSVRIGPAAHPIGVAVVKIEMASLEATWVRANEAVGLADGLGIVFLAGRRDWRYRPLSPLSDAAVAQLAAERRYEGLNVATRAPLVEGGRLVAGGERLRLAGLGLEPDGWQVLAAAPEAPATATAWLVAAMTALGGALLSGAGLFWRQRRQIVRMRLEQADVLERRVAERTADLAREVEERRRAEEELRRTHESLVHAAKLAVLGRMSSTIVHEVSQPLSALDNTLAAAELHLAAGAQAKAEKSLASARGLLRRMQEMVRSLKRFAARARPEPAAPVSVAAALDTALEVLAPRLRELAVPVVADLPADLPPVAGNPGQLQQVLTNLVLNAAEATAGAGGTAPVTLSAEVEAGRLTLILADRGPGIPEELRDKVFEPFFTTRVTGEGLGLGLAIVRTILDHMGAGFSFRARPGGGTLTVLELPLFAPRDGGQP